MLSSPLSRQSPTTSILTPLLHSDFHLRTIPSGLLPPLQHLTKLPSVKEGYILRNGCKDVKTFSETGASLTDGSFVRCCRGGRVLVSSDIPATRVNYTNTSSTQRLPSENHTIRSPALCRADRELLGRYILRNGCKDVKTFSETGASLTGTTSSPKSHLQSAD
jgi:hypothetical protein